MEVVVRPEVEKAKPKLKKLISTYPNKLSVTCTVCTRPIALAEPGQFGMEVNCQCGQPFELVHYRAVTDPRELERWLEDFCVPAPATSFDYETTGLDIYRLKVVGVSFCPENRPADVIYVPVRHRVGDNMKPDAMKSIVAPFLAAYPTNAHNASFEVKVSQVHLGVNPIIQSDTQIEVWLDDLNRASRFDARSIGLKSSSEEIFNIETIDIHDLVDLKKLDFSYVPTNIATIYGCQDADLTTRLKRRLYGRNRGPVEAGGQPSIHHLEHELIDIVTSAELRGVVLNLDALATAGPVLDEEFDRLLVEIEKLTGIARLDVSSSDQVADLLFRKMGVPYDPEGEFMGKPTRRWPDGQPGTSKKALSLVKDDYPIVDLVLQAREIKYARENYVDKLPKMIRIETSTLHCNMNQTGTPTGRFSSSNPNLQACAKLRD